MHHPHHHNHTHLYPVTTLTPKQQHNYEGMAPVFRKHHAALEKFFNDYASFDRMLEPLGLYGKLEEKSFVKFMKDFNVIPELASRVEVVEIFRAGRKGTKMLDGEVVKTTMRIGEHMSHGTHEKYCGFGDFLVMLSAASMKIFTGGKWEKRFPRVIDKGRLLLFWMDQESRIFKGNGEALMGKVVEVSW
jgi:hypothetical protein